MRLTEEQRHALSMLVVVTGHLDSLMSENDEFNNWFSTLGVFERSTDEVQASVLMALEEDNERKRSE